MRSRSKKTSGLTKDQEIEIKEAFDIFDTNKSGTMDNEELRDAMRALGFDVTKEETMRLIQKTDMHNEGEISFDVFRAILTPYMLNMDPVREIKRAFCLFDVDHKGYITIDNLKTIAEEMGDKMTDEELSLMIEKFDTDNDGKISFDEFFDIMDPTHSLH